MVKLKKINTVIVVIMILLSMSFKNKSVSQTPISNEKSTTNQTGKYPIVATGQVKFFNNESEISAPQKGDVFYGQDAQYIKKTISYTNNNDGTITDNVTGLVWQKAYKVMTYEEAVESLKTFELAGKTDWRIPTIKELYSIMNFNGADPSGKEMYKLPSGAIPFIDTNYFDFEFGSNGERVIDTQLLSSTIYKGKTMLNNETVFGLNVADGRIKGYGLYTPRTRTGKKMTVHFVRGNTEYGKNNFEEKDGMITDKATNLIWAKEDSKKGMNWEEALAYAEKMNAENYLGHSDWRLPNAKELHSIVDYNRSPQETNSAAIDPIFDISTITDEEGNTNYPQFWTSTTHKNTRNGKNAVYICFGEALGFFAPPHSNQKKELMDVHGAGAQRSDPKTGNASDYPQGHGPQGDVIRIDNYVRLVRDVK